MLQAQGEGGGQRGRQSSMEGGSLHMHLQTQVSLLTTVI